MKGKIYRGSQDRNDSELGAGACLTSKENKPKFEKRVWMKRRAKWIIFDALKGIRVIMRRYS